MEEKKKVIKSARLISWQRDFVKNFEKLDKDETLVVCSPRQVGKSFTLAQILFYVAINRPGSKSIYISPTNDSSRKFFQDMSESCSSSPLLKKLNESLLEITFKNGSTIKFRSAESKLRGNSVKKGGILCLDEANFLPPDIWEIVLPFTNVSHANKIVISSPRLKAGMFYEMYKKAVQGEKGFHCINAKNYDLSMFLDEEQKEQYRSILSPQAYKSEILGEFIDSNQGVFGDFQSIFLEPEDDEPVYCGLDFSNKGGDDTVLTGFNENKEMCLLEVCTGIEDPVERASYIAQIINSHPGIKKVVCETNSMGETYISILKKMLNNPGVIVSFTTDNKSKKRIIEQLIASIGKKTITLLPNPLLDFEFGIYEMQELKNGNYTYNNAKVKGGKDDIVMSIAFSLDGFVSGENKGTYSLGWSRRGASYKRT